MWASRGRAPPEASAPGLRLPLFMELFRMLRGGSGDSGRPASSCWSGTKWGARPKGAGEVPGTRPYLSRKEAGQAQP